MRSDTSVADFGATRKWLIILKHIADTRRVRLYTRLHLETCHGATHMSWEPDQSVRYIKSVFHEYLAYSGITPEWLRGKRVLEVGPGDNLGVAIEFLVHGAAQVTSVDGFFPSRNPAREMAIYQGLRSTYTPAQRRAFESAVRISDTVRFNPDRLTALYGIPIESARAKLDPMGFDLIVSRAVLTEVDDVERAFATMDDCLRPGGYTVHKIAPLHDYMLFRSYNYHPLEFLTVPEPWYTFMSAGAGKPKRRPLSYYLQQMSTRGYDCTGHVVKVLGVDVTFPPGKMVYSALHPDTFPKTTELINEIRPRLASTFRDLPWEDLAAEDAFLIAQKPLPRRHSLACDVT